jgi:hypothetical protein
LKKKEKKKASVVSNKCQFCLFFQKASKGIGGGGSHQKNQPKPAVAH